VEYGLWRPGSPRFSRDARQVRLDEFGLRPGERFTYEYNFFAGWRHDIRVEQVTARSPRRRYPACTGGARQAPPEDCGSLEEFLALLQRWPPVLIVARMGEILADLLDADGDVTAGEALGDYRDELARLLDLARLDKLDRAALNETLHALDTTPESVSDGRQQ
jgi:Plasmid pRiA4b ORF-3-like protein